MRCLALALCFLLAGCGKSVSLYRDSLVVPNARFLVAVFDGDGLALEGNRDNCRTAADLFMRQPGVQTRFWCEE